jgi:competence protein ComEC
VVDHGSDVVPYPGSDQIMKAYGVATVGVPHRTARPGDRFQIGEMRVFVLAAGGRGLTRALPKVRVSNSACQDASRQKQEETENVQSVAVLVQFGDFRLLDDGDLLWNGEQALVCPQNLIGHVDALLLSHHGEDSSNPPTLIRAIAPRAAIMNNGEKKGGSASTAAMLAAAKVELWQLHYSGPMGLHNAPGEFIANEKGTCNGDGIELSADRKGNFTVVNSRNGYRKDYPR